MNGQNGENIQSLATVIRVVMTVIAAIEAIVVWVLLKGFRGFLIGAVLFAIGYFLAWVTTCLLHGFGEIVVNTERTANYLKHLTVKLPAETGTVQQPKTDAEEKAPFSVKAWMEKGQ